MNDQKTGAEEVRWDLSVMYSGLDDPQIDVDVAKLTKIAGAFNVSYKGKLAKTLGQAISDYTEIVMLTAKIEDYLSLLQSTDVANAAVKAKIAQTEIILSNAQGEYLAFFNLEIVALSDKVLKRFYTTDPVVAIHKPWIEQVRMFKPHILSEPVEAALTKRSPFGSGAWSEFFDELSSDLSFDFRGEEKSLTEMLHIIYELKDVEERAEAMRIVNAGFNGSYAKYSAQTLYIVAGLGAVENKERGYKHPMDLRNKSNRIPDLVVEALHNAVMEIAAPLARRFYRLKAAHLGVKTLKWSDRNAPLPFADTTIVPFNEAVNLVLTAYESFSPTLAGIVRRFIDEKRIDAPATKTKRGGAFNDSLVLPGGRPYSFVLLNYLGSNRDAMVLAHELGHGVHGILAGEAQGALMCHTPIAYAETASVFGEMTTFNFLKKRLIAIGNKKSLLALVMDKMDDIINTVVRQIGFSNFERRLHGMDAAYMSWSEPKKLSVEELDVVWLETAKELYGRDGEVFTYENTEHLWSYVNHFHRPFYVYGYAFGELLTHSLYAEQARLGDKFEPLYLDLLRSGNTKNVVELLEPFGLNPVGEQFWINGIQLSLGKLIGEAEQLSAEIKVLV